MLQSSIACYLKLRNTDLFIADDGAISLHFESPAAPVFARVIKDYLFSFRQFLLALVSIASSNSAAFPSESHRISYITSVLETLTPILRNNIFASLSNYQPQRYPSLPNNYFIELRHQEFEHVIYILIRVFGLDPTPISYPNFVQGNFHLDVIGKCNLFEPFLMTLSEITLQFGDHFIASLNSLAEVLFLLFSCPRLSESSDSEWRVRVSY